MDKKLGKELDKVVVARQKVERKISKTVADLIQERDELNAREAELKDNIKASMEKFSVTKFETPVLTITYVAESLRSGIDVTRLKEEKPEIAQEYTKQSKVKSSIRIKLKELA